MIADEESARAWLAETWGKPALARLDRLVALLVAENGNQNLIAGNTVSQVFQRHVADSAQLLRHVPRETSRAWLDLGSGAGFPGLVIAMLAPEREVILVESRARRIAWLEEAARSLDIGNVQVEGKRVEAVEAFPAGVISARAFAPLVKTLDLASRFSTSETLWLLPKGRSAQQEWQSAGPRGALFHVEQSLTDPEAGIIIGHLAEARGRKA